LYDVSYIYKYLYKNNHSVVPDSSSSELQILISLFYTQFLQLYQGWEIWIWN